MLFRFFLNKFCKGSPKGKWTQFSGHCKEQVNFQLLQGIKGFRWQKLVSLNRSWWPSGLTYDVTAVKCCMVCFRSQVWIPAWDNNINGSEVEVSCLQRSIELYLGMRKIQSTKLRKPIWTHWPRSEPALELHSRAVSSVGITSSLQQSQHRKQFQRKTDK